MKVLAIASIGGHWVQLLRLKPAFKDSELVFMSTKQSFADTVKGFEFHCIPDSNRWNKFDLIKTFVSVYRKIKVIKPDVIITTGAAPGLMGVIIGRLMGCKTIWVDSIANVQKLSLSGRIAIRFANKIYTQWPDLASGKIIYNGKVIS
ncbi:hypothetical protein ADIARSV_2697 [Arcticibacter svalbardensis MN12-7]|uniref:Oligosaccharide biosynthesis protein Alg14 like protein n=1 Tax=Arcticibacter svalbardensis MN12-7 TaxID=1150600 RepID=R9GYN6_9SPHI|nr:glycosyltransferase [Arcticibacter svalbardensis]EOR94084.1 hypothetical protein ADIARSV_2697 [Arcticibacter svalbardensis MN12-7]